MQGDGASLLQLGELSWSHCSLVLNVTVTNILEAVKTELDLDRQPCQPRAVETQRAARPA